VNKITTEKFNEVEKLILLDGVYVNGKPYKKGDTVSVSGNDKMQLLASGRAERKDEGTKDSKK